ncbi:hypothetical protein PsAD37_04213 [Pseudovibrio sp. Ad37]|nr:hypothetical protein PsAD37_04213 [Pseudovibrio sp. Ad37]
MEMPRSVKLFEQLCLGSLLLGILLAALQINEMKLQAACESACKIDPVRWVMSV